jgi:hypothetical protein
LARFRTIALSYKTTVNKGTLSIKIQDAQGQIIWQIELKEGQSGSTKIPIRQAGKHTVVVEAMNTGGSFDVKIEIFPLIPARVVDMYKAGEGALRAKILSSVTVVNEEPSPELNSGELMRYLAETVWFPTALLPGEGVDWTPIDENSAVATLNHKGTGVSLTFHFNSRNEVERVTAKNRPREVDGTFEPTPWMGNFRNYQVRNGMLIPIDGEVEWILPEGDLSYWRGHLQGIEYQPTIQSFETQE